MTNPYDQTYVPQYAGNGAPGANDAGHLSALSICHFVYAGMLGLFGLFPIFYIVMGIMFINERRPSGGPPAPDMIMMGWVFVIVGATMMLFAESMALLSLLAGFSIGKRRRYALVMASAGLNCLFVPLGTALGIFTFVVLARPSVKAQFLG